MLEPFVDVCLELGITSPEMERLLRTVFVNRAHKVLSSGARRARSPSDVRIGLMIGVHRNFVREIRTTRPRARLEKLERRHRATALLQAWTSDWQFMTAAGQPRDLPIRAMQDEPSFEMLVQRYMPGVSTGTAIAELRRSGAVRLLPDEQIRLRSANPRPSVMTSASVSIVSERMRQLASTLLHNMKKPEDARICEALDDVHVAADRLPVVRQILVRRSRNFMDALTAELANEALPKGTDKRSVKVGLIICSHEDSVG